MTLTFLGTRGEIEARSRMHGMHSALLISGGRRRVMIDCGADWRSRAFRLRPEAIVLTHAHSDHAAGLKDGAHCPVFATARTWEILKSYRIADRRVIAPRQSFQIGPLVFEAFPVEHSILAPAVGYRIQHLRHSVFYVPDVAFIHERSHVFGGVDAYIGDGASLLRPLIRRRDGSVIGHASIASQLRWCRQQHIRRAIFTHCGSQIVADDERDAAVRVREIGRQCGVRAVLAHDGLRMVV